LSGDRVLATISFRGIAAGTSSIDFYVSGRPAPGTSSISEIFSDSDPNAAASVDYVPDVTGLASIRVRRSR